MIHKFTRLREDGDTIVEVLISLAILTLVLSGAYFTANQSYRNDRDSQEHSEALTIAQTQLEDLRAVGPSPSFTNHGNCIGSSLTATTNCQVDSSKSSIICGPTSVPACPPGVPYYYTAEIYKTNAVPFSIGTSSITLNTYRINVAWTALGHTGIDDVSLYYRVDSK